ncbi:hypothetical protein B0H16DRAFT_1601954 [Mycena metata]|uniref:Uncharacterized protein n=1 Tax=Mycena metata TaxID=1033252 RepID=A0AAD7ML57_9AGAR|nr:hypothetical protein B0H16DRAFT_1601954 [Mycena metata]
MFAYYRDTLRQLAAVDHPHPSAQTSGVLPVPATVPWSNYTPTHGMAHPSTNTGTATDFTPVPIPPNSIPHAMPPLDMSFYCNYLDADAWYDPNVNKASFDGYMAAGEAMGSYSSANSDFSYSDFGFPDGGLGVDPTQNYGGGQFFGGAEEFGMKGVDMQQTIAPTSFGVADWDMYLGHFVEDMQPQY